MSPKASFSLYKRNVDLQDLESMRDFIEDIGGTLTIDPVELRQLWWYDITLSLGGTIYKERMPDTRFFKREATKVAAQLLLWLWNRVLTEAESLAIESKVNDALVKLGKTND